MSVRYVNVLQRRQIQEMETTDTGGIHLKGYANDGGAEALEAAIRAALVARGL